MFLALESKIKLLDEQYKEHVSKWLAFYSTDGENDGRVLLL